MHGQCALVGEPSGEQHRGRGTCGDCHLTRRCVERPRRAVPIDADDRGCGAGVGQDQDHVGTRGGRTGRDPLRCASGSAAGGAEAGEFAATLTGEGEGRRNDTALPCDGSGCGRHGGRGQRRPGGARRDVRGLKGVDNAGRAGELDLGGVRALRGTFHRGGSRRHPHGRRGHNRRGDPRSHQGRQGVGWALRHLFLHADRALAAATTRHTPEAIRQGMIHHAS